MEKKKGVVVVVPIVRRVVMVVAVGRGGPSRMERKARW